MGLLVFLSMNVWPVVELIVSFVLTRADRKPAILIYTYYLTITFACAFATCK